MSINIQDLLSGLGGGSTDSPQTGQPAGQSGGGGGPDLGKALLPAVMGFLTSGGLAKIMSGLQSSGLASQFSSWTGSGDNEPISPTEVKQVLGDQELHQIAEQAGTSDDEAANGLSQMLPKIFDVVTPSGNVPDQQGLTQQLSSLSQQLGI